MKLEIRLEEIVNGHAHPDPVLEARLKYRIGDIRKFVQGLIDLVYKEVGNELKKVNYIGVRITASKDSAGCAFKYNGENFPSIAVGFTGDVGDLKATIAHELLHFLGWDEYAVEKKALELVGEQTKGN